MKEAEREAHLLETRIRAWQRLDTGALLPLPSAAGASSFQPSHCPNCSNSVASNLLELWHLIVKSAPEKVVVTKEAVHFLCSEDFPLHRNVVELKRRILQTIAILSKNGGSELVLQALQSRLRANPDMVQCTDILAKIVEGKAGDGFSQLSLEVLGASSTFEQF
jgi:hypothetical protein